MTLANVIFIADYSHAAPCDYMSVNSTCDVTHCKWCKQLSQNDFSVAGPFMWVMKKFVNLHLYGICSFKVKINIWSLRRYYNVCRNNIPNIMYCCINSVVFFMKMTSTSESIQMQNFVYKQKQNKLESLHSKQWPPSTLIR